LYAVSDNGDGFVFEDFSCLFQWKFFPGDYVFVNTAKIHDCHFLFCLEVN